MTSQKYYEMTVVGGVYQFTWKDSRVNITVERIREDSRFQPSAEIRIKAYPEGHLHWTRVNLLSTRSKNDVAKFCSERSQVSRDWTAIFEEMSVATLDRWRQGDPPVALKNVEFEADPTFVLEPVLLENEATLIYGEGGIGKSYIAALFSMMVQDGVSLGSMDPRKGQVLYIDYETSAETISRRFQRLKSGFGLTNANDILYRFSWQPLAHEIIELQRIVAEHNIDFIVVDSAGPACGGLPNDPDAAIGYFTALRSLQVTSLTIAHKSKNALANSPFGSVYWVNYPRNIYELKKSQKAGENNIHVAMLHKKHNDSAEQAPMTYQFKFVDRSVHVGLESIEDVPDFFEDMTIAEKLVATLRKGSLALPEIVDTIGGNSRSISTILNLSLIHI